MELNPERHARATRLRPLARLLSRAQAVPRPLAAILAVVVVLGVTWALIVPPWQAPDETAHFAYAQSLAERLALPGDKDRPQDSTDQLSADNAFGASRLAFHSAQMRANWSSADEARYRAYYTRHDPSRSDGGGPNHVASNPPLYYLYADVAYWAAFAGDAFDRLYAMRLWGVPLLVLTALSGWLLAGEVLGRRRLPQLACAAVCGLFPMETFIGTSVNPDALLVPLWTLALWLGVRVITRGAQFRDTTALAVVLAAAIVTKATSYAFLPPALLAVLLGWRRRSPDERRAGRAGLACAGFVLVAPVLAWLGTSAALGRSAVNTIETPTGVQAHAFNVGQFLSYVWQYYLPRLPFQTPFRWQHYLPPLPFQTPFRSTSGLRVWDTWVRQGWGAFGWLEISLPGFAYPLLGSLSGAVGVAALALVAPFRDRTRLEILGFFALAAVARLFGLHLTDYRSIIAGNGPFMQGRYLLPVIGLFGLCLGLIISRLPARWRGAACGALVAGLMLLQVVALSAVIHRYYT